jgi:hypothetical protein
VLNFPKGAIAELSNDLNNWVSEGSGPRIPMLDSHQHATDGAGAKLVNAKDGKRTSRLSRRVPVGGFRLDLEQPGGPRESSRTESKHRVA